MPDGTMFVCKAGRHLMAALYIWWLSRALRALEDVLEKLEHIHSKFEVLRLFRDWAVFNQRLA